ncbi:hypothetical protein Ddye_016526 [Dipteronia dyeriana]|uniref:Reverse transcriptase domain-containing protein n=1 Tax=Dipteronia dyeriana TaxID=168575 RepID=A0AAD9X0E3_9ROSI|nr:hypothetical protein Ddye_016526 [Dipteronia dyeriana]
MSGLRDEPNEGFRSRQVSCLIFFQKFWSLVGTKVTRVYQNDLNGRASVREFNNANVVLIPKIKNPSFVSDFIPISLCSVVYKIITKALANRLKDYLPSIITPNQSTFIPGSLIFDNVLVSFKTIHSISHRKKERKALWSLS